MSNQQKTTKARQYRKQYSPAFKQQVVELCKVKGAVKRDIAERYEISESMLYEWIKCYDKYGTFDRAELREAKMTQVERLEKRIERLELENNILKDTALILERMNQQDSKR